MAISVDVLTMRAAGDGIDSTSREETMRRFVVAPVLAFGLNGTASGQGGLEAMFGSELVMGLASPTGTAKRWKVPFATVAA